ncbi:MAG TPA: helix-turn-helix transcriptional regulator [Niastella sp.]
MDEAEFELERIKLGKRLRSIRRHRGLNQLELSIDTKIDESDISKYERGLVNLSIDTLKRLAHALQVEIYDLVSYDGPLPDNTHFKSNYPKKVKSSVTKKKKH